MDITVIRSRRKSISLQVRAGGQVVVRCPLRMKQPQIEAFVRQHQDWIDRQLSALPKGLVPFTAEELEQLRQRAKEWIPGRAAYIAPLLGVTYGKINILHQKTRWGSCSAAGNLNFNCLLMLAPPQVADYVVVHELCHRKQMNHSPAFWKEVERVCPDYRSCRQWLKVIGTALVGRLEDL